MSMRIRTITYADWPVPIHSFMSTYPRFFFGFHSPPLLCPPLYHLFPLPFHPFSPPPLPPPSSPKPAASVAIDGTDGRRTGGLPSLGLAAPPRKRGCSGYPLCLHVVLFGVRVGFECLCGGGASASHGVVCAAVWQDDAGKQCFPRSRRDCRFLSRCGMRGQVNVASGRGRGWRDAYAWTCSMMAHGSKE